MKLARICFIFILAMQVAVPASAYLCQASYREIMTNKMDRFEVAFGTKHPIIGMIHLAGKNKAEILETALTELKRFEKAGVDAAIIENYHGRISHVEMVLREIQGKFPKLKIGINILPNDYQLAFILARKYQANFIQLDYVAGKYEDMDGDIQLDYQDYYQYRKAFPDILVLGGVHPKYYQPVEGSRLARDLETAKNRADAIVVTGAGTGKETPLDKVARFRSLIGNDFPLVIGAGVTAENAKQQLPLGNGAIVGSYFKDGDTYTVVKPSRVNKFMETVRTILKGMGYGTSQ